VLSLSAGRLPEQLYRHISCYYSFKRYFCRFILKCQASWHLGTGGIMERRMVLFIGIQASGKTSFYKQYMQDSYEHISLDILHTRNKENIAIETCLADGRSFVIDNTNPSREDRRRYITKALEYGYYIEGYYFSSVIAECINRNEKRTGKACVPGCAIASTYNKLELPLMEEGFDKLHYVKMLEDGFIIKDWDNEDGGNKS